jgi:hypothetical protein
MDGLEAQLSKIQFGSTIFQNLFSFKVAVLINKLGVVTFYTFIRFFLYFSIIQHNLQFYCFESLTKLGLWQRSTEWCTNSVVLDFSTSSRWIRYRFQILVIVALIAAKPVLFLTAFDGLATRMMFWTCLALLRAPLSATWLKSWCLRNRQWLVPIGNHDSGHVPLASAFFPPFILIRSPAVTNAIIRGPATWNKYKLQIIGASQLTKTFVSKHASAYVRCHSAGQRFGAADSQLIAAAATKINTARSFIFAFIVNESKCGIEWLTVQFLWLYLYSSCQAERNGRPVQQSDRTDSESTVQLQRLRSTCSKIMKTSPQQGTESQPQL